MHILEKLILKALEMFRDGECDHITSEEIELISNIINKPKTLGREAAAKHLGICLNRFHELINEGVIPKPRKVQGFKEKQYYLSDLDKIPISKVHKRTNNPKPL